MKNQNMILEEGSVRIASDAIIKIAGCAAAEVEGVAAVSCGEGSEIETFLESVAIQKPITVEFKDGTAVISVSVVVADGVRVPSVAEKIQENVKASVQNMAGVAVGRVNVYVAGIRKKD